MGSSVAVVAAILVLYESKSVVLTKVAVADATFVLYESKSVVLVKVAVADATFVLYESKSVVLTRRLDTLLTIELVAYVALLV